MAYCLFSLAFSIEAMTVHPCYLLNRWIWEKSVGGTDNPYVSNPKTIGFNKEVVFTSQGRVITYKNTVEIRNNPYQVEKGIGYVDHLEHELLSFEGTTYIIENIDNHNLTILTNDAKAARTIYKR
ncbi:hypothetical protein [Flavobacterium sp. FlaQc-47]|uniref:hypothetical protein n=1 Tax=Flavobacterium sp. FlaQc-47 TaxID=3374180 RepID=UPI003757173E